MFKRSLVGLLFRSITAVLLLAGLSPRANALEEKDVLPVDDAFRFNAEVVGRDRIELSWTIAPGYYLYKQRFAVLNFNDGFKADPLKLPAGEKKHDEFLGDVEVYHHKVTAVLTGSAAADAEMVTFKVRYQGCAEAGLCYPPQQQLVSVSLPGPRKSVDPVPAPEAGPLDPPATAPMDSAPAAGSDLPFAHPAAAPIAPAASSPIGAAPAAPPAAIDGLPIPEDEAFKFEAIVDNGALLARFSMPDRYYLYRDKTSFKLDAEPAVDLMAPQWPRGIEHRDEHFGKVTVFFGTIDVPIPLVARAPLAPDQKRTAKLTATFQGCQLNGICYPPMTRTISLDLPAKLPQGPELPEPTAKLGQGDAVTVTTPAPPSGDSADAITARLQGNRLSAMLWFFLIGIGLAFTPCIFPMIPILSGIIAGAGEGITTRRAFLLSLVYVLASAVVFALAGVVAGLAGANLQAALQKPAVLIAFAGVFVVLALSMFGFYELQMPAAIQNRINALSNQQQGGSLIGVAIMGVLSALLVGPCVTPPLAAAVIFISQTRDAIYGGLVLFALGLGMGAPLVVIGAGAGSLLPRAGAWMDTVKSIFGVVFLGLALWMLDRVVAPAFTMLGLGALLIGSAIYLGALEGLPAGSSGWRKFGKAVGIILLLLGAAEVLGAAVGRGDWMQPLKGVGLGHSSAPEASHLEFTRIKTTADLDRVLAEAGTTGKPVLLDFYADWCVSCKEMEKYTFPDAKVQAALAGFTRLKADVTANDDADQALMKRFGIIGPPGTLFFGCKAEERRDARLVGFEEAGAFAARLARLSGC